MFNLKTLINEYNKKKIWETKEKIATCSCTSSDKCEVNGQCLQKSLIYNAKVTQTSSGDEEFYIGQTSRSFKSRLYGHRSNFKLSDFRNEISLAKHVWSLKDDNEPFTIDWKIIQRPQDYKPSSNSCLLCATETYYILFLN